MQRFLTLVAVALVAGAMYVAASSASQTAKGPTAKQFSALKRQVAGLSRTVKGLKATVSTLQNEATGLVGVLSACMQGTVPIDQFGDPNGTFGYHWYDPTDGEILITALDVTSSSDTNALWFPASQGTGCQTALGGLRHNAAKSGFKLQHFAVPSTFGVHQH